MKKLIKILSMLMVLALLVATFAACSDRENTGDTDTSDTQSDTTPGTDDPETDPQDDTEIVKITNVSQFLILVDELNKNPDASKGKTYKLIKDIELYSGWDASPSEKLGKFIAPAAITEFAGIDEFYGVFDGNGKTISGVYMAETAEAGANVAIFKKLNGGTIKNLTVNTAFIYDDGAKGAVVSGLVGTVNGDNAVIENVTVNVNVYAASDSAATVAGVVGKVEAENLTLKNVTFGGKIGNVGADLSIDSPSTAAVLGQMIADGGDKTVAMSGCKANGAILSNDGATADAFCAKGASKLTKTDCTVTAPQDDGVASSVVEIYTVEEFKTLATLGSDFEGKTVKLMRDITLDKSATASIAVFKGVLDGNGKIISGFNGESLIGTLNGGTVKNLMILDSVFTSAAATNVGVIGTVENGTVIDLYSEAEVSYTGSADAKLGGIAGVVSGSSTFENVVFAGSIEANGKTADLIANGTATYKNVLAIGTGATTAATGTCVLTEKKDAAFLEGNTAYADWSYSVYLGAAAPTTVSELLRFLQLTPDTSWYNDTDTTFEISTPEQLLGLSVLGQTNTFEGKTIKLTANINLNPNWDATTVVSSAGDVTLAATPGNVWTTIPVFKGTLDGQGYRISGIYSAIAFTVPESAQLYIGGFINELIGGTVKNVIVDNSLTVFAPASSSAPGTSRIRTSGFISRVVDANLQNVYVDIDAWMTNFNKHYTFGGLVCSIETEASDDKYVGKLENWVYAGSCGRIIDGKHNVDGGQTENINFGFIIGASSKKATKAVVDNISFIGSVYKPAGKLWCWDDGPFAYNSGANTNIANDNNTLYHNIDGMNNATCDNGSESQLTSVAWNNNSSKLAELKGEQYKNDTYEQAGFKLITIENGAGVTDPIMLPGAVVDMLNANNQ